MARRARRDMNPTPSQLANIREVIRKTAAHYARRLSPECVEDLVQEVLLRLWKFRAEEKLRDSPAYVNRVAHNTTIDMLRRYGAEKRRVVRIEKVDTGFLPWQSPHTPEQILIAREEAEQALEENRTIRTRVMRMMRQLTIHVREERI